MIVKELDSFIGQDKFSLAGRRAEEQIAHYLKRFFGKDENIHVLNGLRIELEGEFAQIDHLILHPYGMLIVESKSVTGSIQIKEDGQWIRWFSDTSKGMRSPITQAQMQAKLLMELLTEKVKQKRFFDGMALDVLVAISDDGQILWPKSSAPLTEVCKADQVPQRIKTQIERLQTSGSDRQKMTFEHLKIIGDFLTKMHKPLVKSLEEKFIAHEPVPTYFDPKPLKSPIVKTVAKGALPEKICKYCHATELEMAYGHYGYYFKCKTCEKNTPSKFMCQSCGGEGRIRKQGKDFFAECKNCTASALYHSN